MHQKKRGYFFVFDALLGLLIIIIGIVLISSFYNTVKDPEQVSVLSDDTMEFLSSKRIKDINSPYAGVGGDLWNQGYIQNEDNTLLQQIGTFYRTKNPGYAENFTLNVTNGIIPQQFRYEVWMNGTLVYPRGPDLAHNNSKARTNLLIVSRKIAFGILNTTTAVTFGPYKAEVYVWER